MTQKAKLHRKFIEGRRLTFAEFCTLLEAFGYRLTRISGSHHVYHHAVGDTRTIQPRGKDAKDYQLRQFASMIDLYGLTME